MTEKRPGSFVALWIVMTFGGVAFGVLPVIAVVMGHSVWSGEILGGIWVLAVLAGWIVLMCLVPSALGSAVQIAVIIRRGKALPWWSLMLLGAALGMVTMLAIVGRMQPEIFIGAACGAAGALGADWTRRRAIR